MINFKTEWINICIDDSLIVSCDMDIQGTSSNIVNVSFRYTGRMAYYFTGSNRDNDAAEFYKLVETTIKKRSL